MNPLRIFFRSLAQTPDEHAATMARLKMAARLADFAKSLSERSCEFSDAGGAAAQVNDMSTAYRAMGRAGALHEVAGEVLTMAQELVQEA